MKRFAASKIVFCRDCVLNNHVIEIEGKFVIKDYSLENEEEATEWIGGMIVLSPYNDVKILSDISICDFIDKYASKERGTSSYAWHIFNTDITCNSVINKHNIVLLNGTSL